VAKLVAGTFVSLDGVMQAPGGPDEDRSGGFEQGGWTFGYWNDEMMPVMVEQTQRADALLLGRKTYDIFAAHWPRVPDEDPVAAKLNRMPKYVASNTVDRLDWNHSTLVRGDRLKGEIARLKAQPDMEIQVTGSCGLLQTLIREDLVDTYVLWVFPVVLGSGKRLFGGGAIPAGFAWPGAGHSAAAWWSWSTSARARSRAAPSRSISDRAPWAAGEYPRMSPGR
jgi:dihydrofolate reductase